MSRVWRFLALLGLLSLILSTVAISHVAAGAYDDDDTDDADEMRAGYGAPVSAVCRTIFLNVSSQVQPSFPAGSKSSSVIAYQNNHEDATQIALLVIGFLQPLGQYDVTLQNFSSIRQARKVAPRETVNMHYNFILDPRLEAGDYNMVIAVYFKDMNTNATTLEVAYNGTVSVSDPLGTDPHTILTYLTILLMLVGGSYVVAEKTGISKMIKAANRQRSSVATAAKKVETGTGGADYDPAYISPEHYRYREELLHKSSSSPAKRKSSASPKKGK